MLDVTHAQDSEPGGRQTNKEKADFIHQIPTKYYDRFIFYNSIFIYPYTNVLTPGPNFTALLNREQIFVLNIQTYQVSRIRRQGGGMVSYEKSHA